MSEFFFNDASRDSSAHSPYANLLQGSALQEYALLEQPRHRSGSAQAMAQQAIAQIDNTDQARNQMQRPEVITYLHYNNHNPSGSGSFNDSRQFHQAYEQNCRGQFDNNASQQDWRMAQLIRQVGWNQGSRYFDPRAQQYDPRSQYYDPRGQYYDPRAQQYDPRSQYYDPRGQYYDPRAQQYDPRGQYYDPRGQYYDPRAQQYDPRSQYYDPRGQYYDPRAQQYDPRSQYYDPRAQQYDPRSQYYDPRGQYCDPRQQAIRYDNWQRQQYNSCSGQRFDGRSNYFDPRFARQNNFGRPDVGSQIMQGAINYGLFRLMTGGSQNNANMNRMMMMQMGGWGGGFNPYGFNGRGGQRNFGPATIITQSLMSRAFRGR